MYFGFMTSAICILMATRSDKCVGLLSMMQEGSTDVTSRGKAYTEINPTGAAPNRDSLISTIAFK